MVENLYKYVCYLSHHKAIYIRLYSFVKLYLTLYIIIISDENAKLKYDLSNLSQINFPVKTVYGNVINVIDGIVGSHFDVSGENYTIIGVNAFETSEISEIQRSQITAHVRNDGGVYFTGTSSSANVFELGSVKLPKGTWTVKGFYKNDINSVDLALQIRNSNNTQIALTFLPDSSRTITLDSEENITLRIFFENGITLTEDNNLIYPQICYGVVDKPYEKKNNNIDCLLADTTFYANDQLSVSYQVSDLNDRVHVYQRLIQSDNYNDILPNVDDISENIVYHLNLTKGSTDIPSGLPFTTVPNGEIYTLITYANIGQNNIGATQFLYSRGKIWARGRGVKDWPTWILYNSLGIYVTVGKDGCDYEDIIPAVQFARQFPNSYVYVNSGEYDLIAEFKKHVSETFFSDYNYNATEGAGLNLYNGITIEMSSNAKLTCNYDGSDVNVRSNFSPLQAIYGDFTLINVTIEAKNVRYCVHDDNQNKNIMASHHKYINCSFTLDNTEMQGSPDTMACIGGGLDYDSYIEVLGCYFNSLGSPTRDIVNTHYLACAGYHNANVENAKSHIVFKDCYCENGTFTFGKYGSTTQITEIEVLNCSLKSTPYTYFEAESQYSVENMVLRKWNNEIRS